MDLRQVVCGAYHTVAATLSGRLLSWGCGLSGMLGRPMHGLANASSLLPGEVGGLLTRQRPRSGAGMEQWANLRQCKAMKHKGGEAKAKEDATFKHDKEVAWFFLALLRLPYSNVTTSTQRLGAIRTWLPCLSS